MGGAPARIQDNGATNGPVAKNKPHLRPAGAGARLIELWERSSSLADVQIGEGSTHLHVFTSSPPGKKFNFAPICPPNNAQKNE